MRRGGGARRVLPLDEFLRGPYETALEEGDLLRLDPRAGDDGRHGHRPPQAGLPRAAGGDGRRVGARGPRGAFEEARIASAPSARSPLRASEAESLLAARRAARGCRRRGGALRATRSTTPTDRCEYKRQLVRVLVGRALAEALARAA